MAFVHKIMWNAMAKTIGHITYFYDQKNTVDLIILDFHKAINFINHHKLGLGLYNNMISWVENFLTYRQQYIEIAGEKSNAPPVISGVLQDSIVQPLLF